MAEIKFNEQGEVVGTDNDPKAVEAGEFRAPPLTCTLTDHEGNEVGSFELQARAYKPDEKSGMGGIGWFAALPNGEDTPQHPRNKVYLSGQVRVSVLKGKGKRGLKIKAGDKIELK